MILAAMFIFFILTITVYKVEERKAFFNKKVYDNSIINSLLYANLCDLPAYATMEELIYQTPDSPDGVPYCFGDMKICVLKAQELAKENFTKAFIENASLKKIDSKNFEALNTFSGIKKITINDFILYDAFEGKIYSCDDTGAVKESALGSTTFPTGEDVKCSSLYIDITITYDYLGKDVTLSMKKHIGIK